MVFSSGLFVLRYLIVLIVSIIFESITLTASTFTIGFSMSRESSFNMINAYKFIYFVHAKLNKPEECLGN